ncbi:hypothetical protein EJB05_35314, partial [Eragrostis curvula]
MGEAAASGGLSSRDMSELRQIVANLGPLSDCSGIQLPYEPQVQPRDIVSPSRGGELFLHSIFETMQEEFLPFDVTFDSVEVAEGSSLACDEAVEPFVAATNRIRLPQVEDELVLQGGDTLYKSLLSSQVNSLAITHASLCQYRELIDRDTLRKDLSVLETKVKEKEEALALSEKHFADLSSEKETLSKSAKDFETKVASLDKRVEELDESLAKARNDNEDLRGKVDAADQELAALTEADRLRLSDVCNRVRDALVSVGTVPDQLPEDASIEYCQAWLTANIPYVVKACRTFSNNAVHLAIRDLLHSLESGGSDALAKDVCDSFSFISTHITPPSLIKALVKFVDHIDESFWSRVLAIGRQPQSEDSSDFFLSEFATPEPSSHSDSDPLSPVEGDADSFTFPPGSLVAIGRVYNSGSDVSKGRRKRGRRGSRGRCSRSGPSSRGSVRKKRGGQGRRNLSVDSKGSHSRFDAASHVERMVSSGVVDPAFQWPYSPSSGYDFDEFSIIVNPSTTVIDGGETVEAGRLPRFPPQERQEYGLQSCLFADVYNDDVLTW